jgi:5-formyltetrahydrofolate cyclo-ligase
MLKQELRKQYLEFRKQLDAHSIEKKSVAIVNLVLQLPIWEKTYFHVYLPIIENNEVDTEYLLHILSGKDKEIVVSKSNFDSYKMTHYLLTDNTKLMKNKYNIPEPINGLEVPVSKIDVVFVPLLAFDLKGNRVGYGKGFYDSFLSECRPETIKIGLSFFETENVIEDVFENDVKLDFCVTPDIIYEF